MEGSGDNREMEERARQVLLVEDEALVAMELEDALRGNGWEVLGPASTLDEAHAMVAQGVAMDAAVVDINLQGRWVHSLAEELRRRNVPFVVMSGYEVIDPDGRFEGMPVLTKPTSSREVCEALDTLASRPTPPAAGAMS